MHKSALKYGKLFFDTYAPCYECGSVIDIGAQNINGSLKSVCPSNLEYCGVDFVEGAGVDVILDDPYKLPFEDESAEIVVSSSCFEHSEHFWIIFLEIIRILKPNGVFYLNVPSNGYIHRYPVDCWRFYPDSGSALVSWAVKNGFNTRLLESFVGARCSGVKEGDAWNDYVAVFLKDGQYQENFKEKIIQKINNYTNGIVSSNEFIKPSIYSEDQSMLLKYEDDLNLAGEQLSQSKNRIEDLEGVLIEKENENTVARKKVKEKNKKIAELDAIVVKKENIISSLDREKIELLDKVEKTGQEIAKSNQKISEQKIQIHELREQMLEWEQFRESANRELREKVLQVEDLQKNIEILLNSRSWKITYPLRFVGDTIRKILGVRRALKTVESYDGSYVKALQKSRDVYKREGWVGLKNRIQFRSNISNRKPHLAPIREREYPVSKDIRELNLNNLDGNAINYYGYIRAESGLGTACRGYINALKYGGRNVCALNLPCGLKEIDFKVENETNEFAMFNIVHMNADSIEYFFSKMGNNCLEGRYNIGIWVWELAAFRPDWYESFKPFNEIWVPSEFCKESISAISPIPVYVVPHVVSITHSVTINGDRNLKVSGKNLSIADDVFVFGYMFDCSSSIARKNPFPLIDCFISVFKEDHRVILLLKISNSNRDKILYESIRSSIAGYNNIFVINDSLSELELNNYFSAIDCYVSPHRSEGYGLTIAEAMLRGKPVIATDYGGTRDFVMPEHSYPVRYNLTPIREQHGPYLPNYLWAEIDREHLVERLEEVVANKREARNKGDCASKFIQEKYSTEIVSNFMNDRFNSVLNQLKQ